MQGGDARGVAQEEDHALGGALARQQRNAQEQDQDKRTLESSH
jgi:hypothetical protein